MSAPAPSRWRGHDAPPDSPAANDNRRSAFWRAVHFIGSLAAIYAAVDVVLLILARLFP